MTDASRVPEALTLTARISQMFPTLSPGRMAHIAAQWPLERVPHLLETSLPGVFALSDVRADNIKRVASAVGEASITVSLVHQILHE